MTLHQRIDAFSNLGRFLRDVLSSKNDSQSDIERRLLAAAEQAVHHNGWFTRDNVFFSLQQWAEALTLKNLEDWLSRYNFTEEQPKTVGVILAGNIPLVGFHDVLSILISGHHVLIKQSSNDKHLLPIILEQLISIQPEFQGRIAFVKEKMRGHDAVIATGSNNTSRYFDYYFKDVPNIIRKNRNSVAILTGDESEAQLQLLADDIFRYYGLGCRNVSKLFVPEGYTFDGFFESIYNWKDVIHDNKYANNYDYNKAIYLMSRAAMLDNNYLLLKEDKNFGSPIGVLFYETYSSEDALFSRLASANEHLQCVVSSNLLDEHIPFGQTQHPKLWDYADNVDTVDFLLKLH